MHIFQNILFTFCSILDDIESENPNIPSQNRTPTGKQETTTQENALVLDEHNGQISSFEKTFVKKNDTESIASDHFENSFAQPLFFEEHMTGGQYYDPSNPNFLTIFKDATSSQIINSNTSEYGNTFVRSTENCLVQVSNTELTISDKKIFHPLVPLE